MWDQRFYLCALQVQVWAVTRAVHGRMARICSWGGVSRPLGVTQGVWGLHRGSWADTCCGEHEECRGVTQPFLWSCKPSGSPPPPAKVPSEPPQVTANSVPSVPQLPSSDAFAAVAQLFQTTQGQQVTCPLIPFRCSVKWRGKRWNW